MKKSKRRKEAQMSRFGKELVQSAKEALDIAKGKAKPVRVIKIESVDVSAIRKRLRLSQDAFAKRFGLSPATVRDWEQGRRNPDLSARILLTAIDKNPDAVANALEAA